MQLCTAALNKPQDSLDRMETTFTPDPQDNDSFFLKCSVLYIVVA